MKTVTVNLDKNMIDLMDKIVQHEIFPNRSECIRSAVRNLLLYHRKINVDSFDKSKLLLTEIFRNDFTHILENKVMIDDQST
ncbi:MAG: ribbon-helix-helix domain-containing protein [Candidatus Hodarchaeales archaeon]|jgi:metal-responsive CopG/Arc/MetJ family transcriptional regulator